MTQDEIIEMARQIANTFGTRMCDEQGDTHGEELYAMGIGDIVDAFKLVASKEREAIIDLMPGGHSVDPQWVCDAIRARGEA